MPLRVYLGSLYRLIAHSVRLMMIWPAKWLFAVSPRLGSAFLKRLLVPKADIAAGTRPDDPAQAYEWADDLKSIGVFLRFVGERDRSVPDLEKAVHFLELSLTVFDQEHFPDEWADAQRHLGMGLWALSTLKNTEPRCRLIRKALKAWLQVNDQRLHTDEWADVQGSLGEITLLLGVEQSSPTLLEEANGYLMNAQAYYESLGARNGYWWVITDLLGTLSMHLAEMLGDEAWYRKAVWYRRQLMDSAYTKDEPLVLGHSLNKLAYALLSLGEQLNNLLYVEESVKVYESALENKGIDRLPSLLNNMGYALQWIAYKTGDITRSEQAIRLYRRAAELESDVSSEDHAALIHENWKAAMKFRNGLLKKQG